MKTIFTKILISFTSILLSVNAFPCTTFIISGKITKDGKPVMFKQRDTDIMQNSLVYFTDGKYKYIGIVNGIKEWKSMVWGGYNETGFAIMNSAAYNNNSNTKIKLENQEGVVMKLALQTCKTVKDFEELLKSLPRPMGVDSNFGVIDAYGGAAYFETGNNDFRKYDVNDPAVAPEGFLVRTNHSMRGDMKKGFGYCRYNTTLGVLETATDNNKNITAQYLFNNISRNLTHSLTKTNLWENLPKERDRSDFRFFIDYIPRSSTSASILFFGAKDITQIKETVMWTILGFPLTSVAIPIWMTGKGELPRAVEMDTTLCSPICTTALMLKKECFPIDYDKGENYINLSAVINQQNNGIMQLIQPDESLIFNKADTLINDLKNGNSTEKDILEYYQWIDTFLSESFSKHFKIQLFPN